jgi:predicted nucleic acid-binding protein
MSNDTGSVFLDSNIWLYIFLPGQDVDKANIAERLLTQFKSRIAVSTQVINETVRNIQYNNVMSEPRIRDLIDSFYQDYQVVPISRDMQIRASSLRENYSVSYWDSLIVAASLEADAETLFSEDIHNGLVVEKQLTILNPFISN